MSLDIIQPKRPKGEGWRRLPALSFLKGEHYFHEASGLGVITAVEVAKDTAGAEAIPCYHISISLMTASGPRRCTSGDAIWVIAAFDMVDSEEDNHVPNGVVRNFWRPVADHLVGIECACKANEPAIKEDKGDFIWRGVTK